MGIKEKILRYITLVDAELPGRKREKDDLWYEILHWLEDNGAKKFRTDDGPQVIIQSPQCIPSYSPEDKDKVIAWLEETGNGAIVQTKTVIPFGTFSKVVHDMITKGEVLPEFVTVGWKPVLHFRREGWVPVEET